MLFTSIKIYVELGQKRCNLIPNVKDSVYGLSTGDSR